MPRPPRRTVAATRRAGDNKATKPVHVDSPVPSSVIPSSPPVVYQRTTRSAAPKSASVLSATSDLDTVPSTLPLPHNSNSILPESSEPNSRGSRNTIARATRAAAKMPKDTVATIEVLRTPSPTRSLNNEDVLSFSTPSSPMRGTKRDSRTAFEEDFAASLAAADEDEDIIVQPDTPTRSSGGPKKKRQSLERVSTAFSDDEENLADSRRQSRGKQAAVMDETIDFNYSSSPERSPAPKKFGQTKRPDYDESEEEEEEDQSEQEEEAVEEMEEVVEAPSRPRRGRAAAEKAKEIDPKHPTTKSLQSLLPKRRGKAKEKAKSKPKATKPTSKNTGKPSSKARSALIDVTKDILDDDELQAIDVPSKSIFGAGNDIMSEDELGQAIYVDSSARSSSVGAPPTPPSPPRRGVKGKGKGRAGSAAPASVKPRKTYGKPRRQDSGVSNKENDTPAKNRNGGNILGGSLKLAQAAETEMSPQEKQRVEEIKKKFKEVDEWDLCFEDAVPSSSSDGVIKGGR